MNLQITHVYPIDADTVKDARDSIYCLRSKFEALFAEGIREIKISPEKPHKSIAIVIGEYGSDYAARAKNPEGASR